MKTSKKTFKKIIFDDLKIIGRSDIIPKITSVRYETYSGGCSLNVSTINLLKEEREFFDNFLKDYQDGTFNGMTDCYEYSKEEKTKERTAKYVFLRNEFSFDLKEKVKKDLAVNGVTDDTSAMKKLGRWYDSSIWEALNNLKLGDI